jgi:hypothetical protein
MMQVCTGHVPFRADLLWGSIVGCLKGNLRENHGAYVEIEEFPANFPIIITHHPTLGMIVLAKSRLQKLRQNE